MDLAGKDFFTAEEAADYACLTVPVFHHAAIHFGIEARRWMNTNVFRKEDIKMLMDLMWRPPALPQAALGTARPAPLPRGSMARARAETDALLARLARS
jgi:hypothetical protein